MVLTNYGNPSFQAKPLHFCADVFNITTWTCNCRPVSLRRKILPQVCSRRLTIWGLLLLCLLYWYSMKHKTPNHKDKSNNKRKLSLPLSKQAKIKRKKQWMNAMKIRIFKTRHQNLAYLNPKSLKFATFLGFTKISYLKAFTNLWYLWYFLYFLNDFIIILLLRVLWVLNKCYDNSVERLRHRTEIFHVLIALNVEGLNYPLHCCYELLSCALVTAQYCCCCATTVQIWNIYKNKAEMGCVCQDENF